MKKKAIHPRLGGHYWQTNGQWWPIGQWWMSGYTQVSYQERVISPGTWATKGKLQQRRVLPTAWVACSDNCTTESPGHLHDWQVSNLRCPPAPPPLHTYQAIVFCFYNLGSCWTTWGSCEVLSSSTRTVNRPDLLRVRQLMTAVEIQDRHDQSANIPVFFSRPSVLTSIAAGPVTFSAAVCKDGFPLLSHPFQPLFSGWLFWP